MKILITGATGFVGRNLLEELLLQGHEVSCLARDPSTLKQTHLALKVFKGDLQNSESLQNAVVFQELIFHVAGVVTAPNQEAFDQHNVLGTENLFKAIASHGKHCQKIVYVSSLAAAGR